MMKLLIPLGLLGLIGILALILIYIIKPNYQTHHISTTFVWKLSLKYKKKRLPTSRVRNIILFICQLLILASIALILAQPAIVHTNQTDIIDVIAIIDSSASMNAGDETDTRFQRAVEEAEKRSSDTIGAGGYVSVILADANPYYLARRLSKNERNTLSEVFDDLELGEITCSYGKSNIESALDLSQEVLAENPSAKIYLYTDTTYSLVPDNVEVVSAARDGEWNAAVLSVSTERVDGFTIVSVDIGCYGSNKDIEVTLDVFGAGALNATENGRRITVRHTVSCEVGSVKTVVFCDGGGVDTQEVVYCDLGADRFDTYQSLHASINEMDNFSTDDDFWLYGGQRELVKVLYASADPNPFFTSALDSMKDLFKDRWQLEVDEVPKGDPAPESGYDLYIFEHSMPDILPTDGAVILADPDKAPAGCGLRLRRILDFQGNLVPCDTIVSHQVTQYLVAEQMKFSRYTLVDFEPGYEAVMSIGADPLLLVQNNGNFKVAALLFNLHYSNLPLQIEWPLLIYNLFDYFLPSTVNKTAYEVDEPIVLNARGPSVKYSDLEDPIEEFPATLKFSIPGTYRLQQELYFDSKDTVNIDLFVNIPREESNIWATADMPNDWLKNVIDGNAYDDLLIYIAAALVALLFLEWFLHSREGR